VRIYDITLPITPTMVVWPGDPGVEITRVSDLERGDPATVSQLSLGAHTGTHIDAPCHFVPGGATVDQIPIHVLVGPAFVADARPASVLDRDTLAGLGIPARTERLLLRTHNSDSWTPGHAEFRPDYVAITTGGAEWLVERGLRLVGIDYLSIAPFEDTGPTHRKLLEAGIVALEGLNLSNIAPGTYELICLPLRIVGGEGAPVRAILIERKPSTS